MNETPTTEHAVEPEPAKGEEVLTVLEVARFLRVPKSTVYKLARLGQLPASRIGKHWRFLRRDVRDWLRARRAIRETPPAGPVSSES
jgi:excisionase family DNA binding protein